MESELIIKVTKILIGSVSPAADAAIDSTRMENLVTMCEVAQQLISDIRSVAYCADSQFSSVKKMADYATKFLDQQL